MNESVRRIYCDLLAWKIVDMYGISLERAKFGVAASAIQALIDEYPIYVDHVPLESWAEDVYEEMIRNGK